MADLDGYVGFPGPAAVAAPGARTGAPYDLVPATIAATGNRGADGIASVPHSALLRTKRTFPVIPTNKTIAGPAW